VNKRKNLGGRLEATEEKKLEERQGKKVFVKQGCGERGRYHFGGTTTGKSPKDQKSNKTQRACRRVEQLKS